LSASLNGPFTIVVPEKGNEAVVAKVRDRAEQRASDLTAVLEDIRTGGAKTLVIYC
jgi:hypothetical protein